MNSITIQIIPKLLLWVLLILSALGTVSSLLKPNVDSALNSNHDVLEQQMAISTATSFAREWLTWYGAESLEDREIRLKPYTSSSVINRLSQLKTTNKASEQKVNAVEFVALKKKGNHLYRIHVRVLTLNPTKTAWEIEVPVAVQLNKGSSVVDSPILLPISAPLNISAPVIKESMASNEVKQRMSPTIESFIRALCEGKDSESLINYVSTGAIFIPMQSRVKLLSIDELLVYSNGPYRANVHFTVQDRATEFNFPQSWILSVVEENQKFFVSSIE